MEYDTVLATSLLVEAGKKRVISSGCVHGQIKMDMIAFAFTCVYILGKT